LLVPLYGGYTFVGECWPCDGNVRDVIVVISVTIGVFRNNPD